MQVLRLAWAALGARPGIRLERLSSPYRTEPVGMNSEHWFINAAGSLATNLAPRELLQALLAVEKDFGRSRDPEDSAYRDRVLDLDLLFYGNTILSDGDLVLPHPEIEHRLFVLYPLHEIAAEYVHPRLRRSVRELLLACERQHDTAPAVVRMSWQAAEVSPPSASGPAG